MNDHHPTLPPSSFPALAKCPCYLSDVTRITDAATEGTRQHAQLAAVLTGGLPDDIDPDVAWAADQINMLTEPETRRVEERLELLDNNFDVITYGTADVIEYRSNFVVVIDYKSGEVRDYTAQLAGYALMAMRRYTATRAGTLILFGKYRKSEPVVLSLSQAEDIVFPIIRAATDPDKRPVPCDYCGWCANAATCQALAESTNALVIAGGHEPVTLDVTALADPALMGRALTACDFAEKQIDAIRDMARRMAIVDGIEIPGRRVKKQSGRREIADPVAAYERTGLTPDQFLSAGSFSVPKLEKVFALAREIPETEAKRELAALLDTLIVTGEPTKCLIKSKE